jgi:hypothetical protein
LTGSLLGAGYIIEAHKKLSKKVDKYGRTNGRVKVAIANYRKIVDPVEQAICGHVDQYLDERAAILANAFKAHAKLHVSVNFNTCWAATRPCKAGIAGSASSGTSARSSMW